MASCEPVDTKGCDVVAVVVSLPNSDGTTDGRFPGGFVAPNREGAPVEREVPKGEGFDGADAPKSEVVNVNGTLVAPDCAVVFESDIIPLD